MPYTALSQLPAARLPKNFTDPRGFTVHAGPGDARVGTVADLLIDAERGAHQFVVDLSGGAGGGAARVLVPFDAATVDAAPRTIRLPGIVAADVARLPAYGEASAAAVTDTAVTDTAVAAAAESVRLTLSDEQLAIGRRLVQTGEVSVRKTVETERVRRTVAVAREEVTVERRPAVGAEAGMTGVEVIDDEIRIPIFADEVVVEKRVVPKETYLVRKRQVVETRTVEADLRHERLDVERTVEGDAGRQ